MKKLLLTIALYVLYFLGLISMVFRGIDNYIWKLIDKIKDIIDWEL